MTLDRLAPAQRHDGEKRQRRPGEQARQRTVHPRAISGLAPDPRRDDGDGRKDAVFCHHVESRAVEQTPILRQRPVARMLHLVGRADQAPGKQEVHARLQVGEVGDRDEQLAVGRQDTVQLGEQKPGRMRALNSAELRSLYKAVGM